MLVQAESLYGDFARLFHPVDEMSAVSAQAVKEVCARYLRPNNRTVGVLVPEGGAQ